ncbi:hypothetical protein EHS25_005494 [Saitozyma podzolica]|uniref:Uncharacterized protein n=1 Tax=Saitozyma podzolica TaxID=1890683 RepID=A0A427XYE9_9TREE|nr:hypothetical protein EHS25_005494 [Saitozyma podzolica]
MQSFSPSPLKITYSPLLPVARAAAPSFSPPIIQTHLDTLPNAEAGPSRLAGVVGVPSLPARPTTPRIILRVDHPSSSSAPVAESGHSAVIKEQSLVLDRVLKLGSQRVRPNALFCAWNGCTAELATPDILSKVGLEAWKDEVTCI